MTEKQGYYWLTCIFLCILVSYQNCSFRSQKAVNSLTKRTNPQAELLELQVDQQSEAVFTPTNNNECIPKVLSAKSQQLVALYDQFDLAFNNGLGYSDQNNLTGLLGHAESHWLDSYIVMFQATNDTKYISKAIAHTDRVLAQRDNQINVTNWRGESLGIWSRNDHSRATTGPFPHMVEQGLITSPIAQLAFLLRTVPCLRDQALTDGRSLQSVADGYVAAVAAVIAFHQPDWHTDSRNGLPIGWYTTPDAEFPEFPLPAFKPPPVNYLTAFGETLAHMAAATGSQSYRDMAERIANWLFQELYQTPTTEAYWHRYWPDMAYYPDEYTRNDLTPEDFGHLAYTMGFIKAMVTYRYGSFDDTIQTRFAYTFTRNLYQPDQGGFVFGMDGTGDEVSQSLGATAPYWAGFYLFLNDWDPNVLPAVEYGLFTQQQLEQQIALGPEGMYSLAEYINFVQ